MSAHSPIREYLLDGTKASPLLVWWGAWFAGVDWGHLGAFVMFLYAVLLVLDKMGLLAPLKRFGSALVARHRPPPAPVVRQPQDE